MPPEKPITWSLQKTNRPKGCYYQAVYGRPPGRRRTITLGYVSQDEADELLAGLRLQGHKLTTVVLPDGSLVRFDDDRAPLGRPLYDDDSVRLGARCAGVGELTWDQHVEEQEFKAAISSGDLARLPLREFYTRVYSPVRDREIGASTRDRERSVWRQVLPVLGDLPLKKVDGVQIERFLTAHPQWGGGARKIALNSIRCCLRYAVDLGVLPELPKIRPIRGASKRVRARPVALLPEQVKAILDQAYTPAHRALYAVAIGQGLRPAEVAKIAWDDVDWRALTLHVRGTKTSLSDRVVPLSPATQYELRPYWESLGRPPAGPAFVFRGRPLTTWEKGFEGAAKRAGLDHVFPYLCRHTFATSCALAGVPKAVTKEMLGHSARSELLESAYTNPHHSQIAEAMQKLTRLGG